MADFTVSNNEFVNFSSHSQYNNTVVFKDSENQITAKWIEVAYLKPGMEIAVPDGDGIKWEKISSLNVLNEQHVYDLAIENTHNFIANDIIAHNTGRYFQYRAYLSTNSTNLTPMLQEVNVSYKGIFTDSSGNYNYTLTAPTTTGTSTIKVNTTYANISGEQTQTLTVKNAQTISLAAGGAFIVQDAAGASLAVLDSVGNLNIKGTRTQNAEPVTCERVRNELTRIPLQIQMILQFRTQAAA